MRVLNIYVLLDEKAKTIVGPVVKSFSEVPIVRELIEQLTKPDSIIGRNPEDFTLYLVGTVDDETGQLTALDEPQTVTTLLALKASIG